MSYRPPPRSPGPTTGQYAGLLEPERRPAPRRRPAPPPRRPPRRLTGPKTVLAIVSALILVVTGYYSGKINSLNEGLTRQDVISGPQLEKPPDGATDILLVGMDSRTDAQGKPLSKEILRQLTAGKADGTLNTDTLILIRIPNDGGKAIGISLPRDSYVDIPGGYGKHKINSAYARAKNDAMDKLRRQGIKDQAQLELKSNLEGAKNLIGTIEKLTGATIDHYAEVNLLGFYDITNAIGGIEVCLNKAVNDADSGAHLPAGKQNLKGAPALAFVRQRHGLTNGDLDRIVRQQVFMAGMAKKVLSGDMLTPGSDTLNQLTAAIQKSVVLDQNWNVIQFAQQMMTFTGGNLEFKTIPVGNIALKTDDGDAVEVNPRDVKAFVQGLLHGGGSQPSSGSQPPSSGNGSGGAITVDVRNASGRTGLANQVSQSLTAQGFKAGQTGNAGTRTKSVVRFASGEQDNGQRVASALGGIPAEVDGNVPKGHVTVLLGKDFDASNGNQLTGSGPLAMQPVTRQQPPAGPGADGCVN
ncbi:MAG TPA: LCP family protein [Actinophytocola sp.]|uniref:LCP family protein n=1 Tax=Actinophytocola sp. TaxID=1872138 RepID=UPI002DF8F249|nr:LCP family protein [Actinophytocola sp.]